jgi:microcin C transport system permease protein
VSSSTSPSSPSQRAWRRFRRNRLGFVSLVIFCTLVVLSLFAEVISNDKPLVVRYNGEFYLPLVKDYPETTFGGDFQTATDYLDPFIREQLTKDGNWAIYPPNPYGAKTINYFAKSPNPAGPTRTTCWAPTTVGATCWPS